MFHIKKIASLTFIALALNACGDNAPPPPPPAAEKPAAPPVASASEPIGAEILVGVDAEYPPYDFRDENGQITGFDVDILKAIGEKQNIKFGFLPETWDKITDNLDNNKFKIALSGFAYSDERAAKYQVSNTYAYGQDIIVTVANNDKKWTPQTREDLKNHKVITLANSPYIEELEAVMGKNNPNIITDSTSQGIIEGLISGKAEAALTDKIVAQYFAHKAFPDVKLNFTGKGDYFEPYPLVLVAHKNEAELMNKINAGLDEIIKDGTYANIHRKWFNEEPKDLSLLGSQTK